MSRQPNRVAGSVDPGLSRSDAASYFSSQPEWFDGDKVVASIDEQEVDPNVMPLKPLLLRATKMEEDEILELTTTYLPAPRTDIMREKGFAV